MYQTCDDKNCIELERNLKMKKFFVGKRFDIDF